LLIAQLARVAVLAQKLKHSVFNRFDLLLATFASIEI
jgi:hypothetical protein